MSVPFYLFKGPEFGEKNDEIQKLKNQAKKQFSQVDFNSFYAMETDVSQVLLFLSNGSLFSDARFVVLKNAELIKKKEDLQFLEDWKNTVEKTNAQDSILILVTDENSVEKKLENLVPKENVKMFWEMFEDRKIPWLKDYFKKNGFNIEGSACEQILNLVENNTEELKNECSRFFVCFENGHTITLDDVDKVLAHNREETAFTLFDAMADTGSDVAKRLENALEILQKIQQSKGANSVVLISGLLYSFRQLKKWHALCDAGGATDAQLKAAGFYSKAAQGQMRKACRIWNLQQTQHIISLLSATDIKLRSMGTGLEETILQTMIYQIVVKNGNKLNEFDTTF